MAKPFIAARIPEALNKALEKHTSKKDGESRTEAIINALNAYLGQPLGIIENSPEVDRITDLEKRIVALEKKTGEAIQGNLLDKDDVIKTDNQTKSKSDKPVDSSDNKIDNSLLTHKQVAETTGMKYETVRSKYKTGNSMLVNGKTYTPTREQGNPRWKATDNKPD